MALNMGKEGVLLTALKFAITYRYLGIVLNIQSVTLELSKSRE